VLAPDISQRVIPFALACFPNASAINTGIPENIIKRKP